MKVPEEVSAASWDSDCVWESSMVMLYVVRSGFAIIWLFRSE